MEHFTSAFRFIIVEVGLLMFMLMAAIGFYTTFMSNAIFNWPWAKPKRRQGETRANKAFSMSPKQRGEIAAIYGFIIGVTRRGFSDPDLAIEEAERYTNTIEPHVPPAHLMEFIEGVESGVAIAKEAIRVALADDYTHNVRPRVMAAIDLKADELCQLHGEADAWLSNELVRHLKQAIP